MAKKQLKAKLSDILVAHGVIEPDTLKTMEEEAISAGVTLEKYLVEKDLVPNVEMTLAISEYLGMPPITLAHFVPESQLIEMIPRDMMNKYQAIPIARTGRNLTVALGDPFDIVAIEELHILTGLDITPLATTEKEIKSIMERCLVDEASSLDMEDIMSSVDEDVEMGEEEAETESLEDMVEGAEDRPLIRMVNMILIEAVRVAANDIHIEPQEDYVRLRYRVDGALIERPKLPKNLQSAIISRVKIMADLDIGENRLPQDGRFRIIALGKVIDVRVSILPTIFGGRVVLRTLDKGSLFPNLASLGLDKQANEAMSYAISQPHGIILVTGPTGCGKTTTLYSCLQELNKPDVNVVTCEDPVEYQIPGIIQVRINPDVGCTFAAALRAILRQDPDIVLIGEIRDAETCEIAIKAALTGHLVLSTLHANDAAGTITRLLDMGMEPFLLASSVILTQAQRLYRKLCPSCRKETKPSMDVLEQEAIDPKFFDGVKIYTATGCPRCHNIGYKGRSAIMEVLPIDDDIRAAILQRVIAMEIRTKAEEKGMVSLRKAGLNEVKKGETSLEEVLKVTATEK